MATAKIPETLSFSNYGEFEINDAGDMFDVSLISTGPALGHGMEVDMRSLETAFEVAGGKSIKAFNGHSGNPKPSEIAGFFSGLYIDAEEGKFKAKNYKWLDAFVKHSEEAFDAIEELAKNHKDQFGISLTHSFGLAWVFEGGVERDAMNDWFFGNPAPEGALNELPAVRFKKLLSADFVDSPAANADGLFSERREEAELKQEQDSNKIMNLLKEINAAYGEKKDDELAKANEKLNELSGGQGDFSTGDQSAEPQKDEKDPSVIVAQYKAMPAGPGRAKFRAENAWAWEK